MKHPTHLAQVAEWNAAFRVRIAPAPDLSDSAINALRCSLLREELLETAEAIRENNRVGILDGLCDTEYVLMGAVLSWGYRAMWENHRHTVTLRKIHDTDAHLAKMLGIVNHLEIVSQGDMPHQVWGYLVELQALLTELVFAMGFSPCFDAAFAAVHANNLAKIWTDADCVESERANYSFEPTIGGYIARDMAGKIRKPLRHTKVDLSLYIS